MGEVEAILEFLLSWRLFAGLGATLAACWLLVEILPGGSIGWLIAISTGICGTVLSFWWQISHDKP